MQGIVKEKWTKGYEYDMFQTSCPCHCNKCMSLLFLGHANSGYSTDYYGWWSLQLTGCHLGDHRWFEYIWKGFNSPTVLRQNQGSSPWGRDFLLTMYFSKKIVNSKFSNNNKAFFSRGRLAWNPTEVTRLRHVDSWMFPSLITFWAVFHI